MNKLMRIVGVGVAALLLAAQAQAIPSLQLDIAGGTYSFSDPNHNPESIVGPATGPGQAVTVYAYLLPDGDPDPDNPRGTTPLGDTYYLSLAVVPTQQSWGPNTQPDLGSIKINGVDVPVTGGMFYGNPPLYDPAGPDHDAKDLSSHDVFQTYYLQLAFTFNPTNLATAYNTQDNAGSGPTPNPNGTMYYQPFSIDTSGLAEGYFIHFDLYNTYNTYATQQVEQRECQKYESDGVTCKTWKTNKITVVTDQVLDIDINSKAPFSHDAETDGHKVPEPGTFLLLGSGLLGLGLLRRRNS